MLWTLRTQCGMYKIGDPHKNEQPSWVRNASVQNASGLSMDVGCAARAALSIERLIDPLWSPRSWPSARQGLPLRAHHT